MKNKAFILFVIGILIASPIIITDTEKSKPLIVWYTVAKYIGPDLFEKAEIYNPDIVILSVFAEDDVLPLNGSKTFDLEGTVKKLHDMGIWVYYSFSLFSRSMYEEIKSTGLNVNDCVHVSDYSKYLRETNPDEYHRLFDYYLERGLDPEKIPKVERKPIEGYYVPIGHKTMVDPLYMPYRDFIADVIKEMIEKAEPDGLVFDHGRFFTFDEGYNQDIRKWILDRTDFDIYNYTPKPIFQITDWTEEDILYYDTRAELIKYAVSDIVSNFTQYPIFATTIGMIEPARTNGQYVELQTEVFDSLLLMEYGDEDLAVEKNIKETAEKIGSYKIILGLSKAQESETHIRNIELGLKYNVKGIYLLGYDFPEDVHEYLLNIRNINYSKV